MPSWALTNDKMIGARDPWGLRPLVLGALEDGSPVLCSETCALDAIGASFVRNIDAGEVVVIDKNGVESLTPFPATRASPCVFEYVYFARPDSIMHGQSVYETRRRFGRILASEAHVDADIICPVPDGGNPAALGYAEASSIPFGFGIIRNHYVGRTFIQPTQTDGSAQSRASTRRTGRCWKASAWCWWMTRSCAGTPRSGSCR